MSSVHINYYGGLGNNILMYLMGQYIAEKYNLLFDNKIQNINDHGSSNFYDCFDVLYFSGSETHSETLKVTDDNIIDFLKNEKINSNIILDGFFQSPEILKDLKIVSHYKKYIRPKEASGFDLFVHIRLGDIKFKYSLPYEYYDEQIQKIKYQTGIIATDTPYDDVVSKLSKKYNIPVLNATPANTMQIGTYCKNLVLSAGTFSYLTALYSKESTVYYIDNPTMKRYFNIDSWGPDIFLSFKTKKNCKLYGE